MLSSRIALKGNLDQLMDKMRNKRYRIPAINRYIDNHFEGSAPLATERLRERELFDGE